MYKLYDMHCHLDFMANASEVACNAQDQEVGVLCATVTPEGYCAARNLLESRPNVWVGCGLHPWWLSDGICDAEDITAVVKHVASSPIVAEIGLDFSKRHHGDQTQSIQLDAFTRIARACTESAYDNRPKLLSIHAVQSASVVLDILERTGCLKACTCVFHWFSGTSNELARARSAGCFFSINEMMLRTRKGREYARQLPETQLLLETDLPPRQGAPFPPDELVLQLERTLSQLASIRATDANVLAVRIAQTSALILGT